MNISINTQILFRKDFLKVTSENRAAIMGLSMISIMLFHQYFTSSIPFNIFHNFGYWGVDVFLFLSGMGLVRSLKNNTLRVYYIRRFKRIIPSCILCGTTKYIIYLILGSSVAILGDGLKMGWWSLASLDLWFIPTIIIFYSISPILYYLLRKWSVITFTAILISMLINGYTLRPIIGYDWNSPLGVFSYTIERMLIFVVGMFVFMRKDWINERINYSLLFFLSAIGIKLLDKFGFSFHGHQTFIYIALTFGMPTLIMINILFIKILKKKKKKCIHFFGAYSLELYLVHEFIFWTLKIIFVDTNPWILIVSSFTLSCLSAYTCKKCIKLLFHY